jgi:hypothetical protein
LDKLTLRKENGDDVLFGRDEIAHGEMRDDGHYYIRLIDGTEGILMREPELQAKRKRDAKPLQDYVEKLKREEVQDKRSELEKLFDNWPNAPE